MPRVNGRARLGSASHGRSAEPNSVHVTVDSTDTPPEIATNTASVPAKASGRVKAETALTAISSPFTSTH